MKSEILAENPHIELYEGDCLEILCSLGSDSIDSVVVDPPYELGFMGKKWDSTGIAYDVNMWREVLRVLKPGGHLLSFGGTRTSHRMVCAIEDAGFEIRDGIAYFYWIYGSGFPKSLNIGKAVDKLQGNEREFVKTIKKLAMSGDDINSNEGWSRPSHRNPDGTAKRTLDITKGTSEWEGWGTALKPSHEKICIAQKPSKILHPEHEPICVARKPLSEKTVAANVLKWGTGGLNIDGCRIPTNGEIISGRLEYQNENEGWDRPWKKDKELVRDRKQAAYDNANSKGRWPANVIFAHHPECVRIGTKKVRQKIGARPSNKDGITRRNLSFGMKEFEGNEQDEIVEIEVWRCVNGCPVKMLDEQSGKSKSGMRPPTFKPKYTGSEMDSNAMETSSAGASRFFYCAKASASERDAGMTGEKKIAGGMEARANGSLDGHITYRKNNHPTVKPLKLMEYLCKLITPPNGTILDMFAGSGTTGLAACRQGFGCTMIELEPKYCDIIRKRIDVLARQERLFKGD